MPIGLNSKYIDQSLNPCPDQAYSVTSSDEVDVGFSQIVPGGLEHYIIVAILIVDGLPEGDRAAITHTQDVLKELQCNGAADETKVFQQPLHRSQVALSDGALPRRAAICFSSHCPIWPSQWTTFPLM